MNILGIESSCDDTSYSVAHVDEGKFVLRSLVVHSQEQVHSRYGGVVPELAARNHIQNFLPCLQTALDEASLQARDLDAIFVTQGPGLIGCLLVGLTCAKSLSASLGIPYYGVDHIHAHLLSPLIENKVILPYLGMVMSGGHTAMFFVENIVTPRCIGETIDDAIGEAFDKGAKMLGLGYPGGSALEAQAKKGDPSHISFPVALRRRGNLNFSFSGLKTSLYTHLQRHPLHNPGDLENLCASYQSAIVEGVVYKMKQALREYPVKQVAISGGVACNLAIRLGLGKLAKEQDFELFFPSQRFCTDNAAMVAYAGWRLVSENSLAPGDLKGDAYAHAQA